jgi:hypothetical protein
VSSGPDSRAPAAAPATPRWCARLGFCRDYWSGRPRVVVDAEIEASLTGLRPAGGEAPRLPGPAAALLAELLPERGGQAWLLTHEPPVAGPAGGRRRGSHALDEFEDVLAEAPWEVALVDLSQLFVDAASLSRFAARARGRLENRLETRAFRLLTALGEGLVPGRVVVVSTPAAGRGGLGLPEFQELLEQHFARARVYALAAVPVAVVVDCGEVVREDEEDDEGEADDEDAEVPLGFDNRLGDDLRYDTYLAVVGAAEPPPGVTLVELPAPPEPVARSDARAGKSDELENLRIQLAQARRQVELAAIARQSLVAQLDAAQARVDALEDQVAELHRRAAAPVAEAAPAASGPPAELRPDAAQAAALALRWELEQVREELRRALGRPVEALEREVAELRARLSGA